MIWNQEPIKLLLFVLLAFSLYAHFVYSEPVSGTITELDNSIKSLEEVSQTINSLNLNIEQLNKVIASLESDSTASSAELEKQKTLRTQYQDRVKQLQSRYEGLLKISKRLEQSLKISATFNWILAGTTATAIVVAVVEGIILSHK